MDSAISLMNMLHKEKHLLKLTLAAVFNLVAGCASANAEEYNAGKFFQLDLKAAILSPVPLGPAAHRCAQPSPRPATANGPRPANS